MDYDNSNNNNGVEAPGTQAQRAEKKRYSDRVAQQRHRQRRKEYINELEAQLRLLQEGGESQMAQLVSENARMRKELLRTNTMLSTIRELLGHSSDDPPERDQGLPAADAVSDDRDVEAAGDVATTLPAPVADWDDSVASPGTALLTTTGVDQPLDKAVGTSASTSVPSPTVPPEYIGPSEQSGQPNQTFSAAGHVLDSVTSWWLDPSSMDAQKPQNYDQVDAEDAIFRQTHSRFKSPLLSSPGNIVELLEQSDSMPWDQLLVGKPTFTLIRHHYAIPPRIVMPPPARDSSMHRILHVARTNLEQLASPNLHDFFLKDTPNPLSREIKAFNDPMRQMNKSLEYLAVYWILYLLFRWQAALDEASYQELPTWLRPTQLQLEVEHHFLFDQVPWPDLREELIKLSTCDMDKAFDALTDIGRHLVVNIYPAYEWSGMNAQQLNLDITNLGRWKLDHLFFRKHPQWSWTSAR